MNTKKLLSAVAVASALAAGVGVASAQPIFFSPVTTFEDDNLDRVFDNNSNGIIDVGDRLLAVVEFNQTSGILAGQGPATMLPRELTGIADVTVAQVLGPNIFRLVPTGAGGALSGFAAGTAVALWLDPNPNLNVINGSCGTQAQCQAAAMDGALWATFGFFGDTDASWVANTQGNSIATVQGGNATATFGTFNFALDVGINNSGVQFADQSCAPFCSGAGNGLIEVVGQGSVLGGQGLDASQWTARSDNDFQVVAIPEPGSLALLGVGLAAVGALRRRKSK